MSSLFSLIYRDTYVIRSSMYGEDYTSSFLNILSDREGYTYD